VLAVLAEFYTRRARLLSRTVKHVINKYTRDLPVELVQQVLPSSENDRADWWAQLRASELLLHGVCVCQCVTVYQLQFTWCR
jgi:hypothetical protein